MLELFRVGGHSDGKINGWTISRKRTATEQATMGEIERAHVFMIRGVYGLKDADATESTFQALIEDIQAAFEADDTLGGACRTIDPDWGPMSGAVGLQVDLVEPRMFGGVLCHYAECRLCAIEALER
jgi:hypothetical protein